jgi:hypothetical protein
MPHKLDHPHMDPRLAERIKRKKAQLDHYRPLPNDIVRRLNDDLRVFLTYHSNAIEGNSLSLQETQMVIDYGNLWWSHEESVWYPFCLIRIASQKWTYIVT